MNIGLKRRVPDRDRNQEVAPTGRRAGFESDLNYRVCVSLQMKVVTLPGWKPFGLAGGAVISLAMVAIWGEGFARYSDR
jgi:hypothetical protein